MGIQNDIFDVEAALSGTAEANSFDRIYTYLAELERQLEKAEAYYEATQKVFSVIADSDQYKLTRLGGMKNEK